MRASRIAALLLAGALLFTASACTMGTQQSPSAAIDRGFQTAYTADRTQIEAAVAEFMIRPSDPSYHHAVGDVPLVNDDAVEVSGGQVKAGQDYYVIAICPLITSSSPRGMLHGVPDSVHPDNCVQQGANAEPGMAACQAQCTGSYIWLITENGDIASVCVGDDCNAENRDGFQVAYP
jgi:hypothetical protein